MTPAAPPRLAMTVLRWILDPADREHALGDLHEEFLVIAARQGSSRASRWYWRQAAAAVPPSLIRRIGRPSRGIGELAHEFRCAVRSLRRRPGLTIVAVSTLALGIGSATAIFSVANAVLFRPLPYPGGERLVQVWNTYDSWRGHEVLDVYWDVIALSYPEYLAWLDAQESFEQVALYATTPMPLTGAAEPDEVPVGLATESLFPLLGAEPVLGRNFVHEEIGPIAARVAVLSFETWRDAYGSDPGVLGRSVNLAGVPFAIIGVLPRGFWLRPMTSTVGERHAVWVPVGGLGESLGEGDHSYEALALLDEGRTLQSAHAETLGILAAGSRAGTRGVRLTYRKTEEAGDAAQPLFLLMGAVAILMLIACGNVATLLLAEATRRRAELATRSALGAGGGRILRQLLMESVVLGVCGALLGLGIATGAVNLIFELVPGVLPVAGPVGLDRNVLMFVSAAGIGTGVLFGLLPGLWVLRGNVTQELHSLRYRTRSSRYVQRGVITAQASLALVLLVSGGLLARSSTALGQIEPGYDPEDLLSARLALSPALHDREAATQLYHEVADALESAPGVERATLVSAMPFSGLGGSSSFQIVGREVPDEEKQPEAKRRTVLPNYHRALSIPLRSGRYLEDSDRMFDAPVVLISESLARRYWPQGDALGKRISRDRREFEIVGVVGDVLDHDLSVAAQPTFYVPFDVAENRHRMTVVVRSSLPVAEVASLIRRTVWAIDETVPVEDVATASALVARSTQDERFRSLLLMVFALTATVLSAVGLFGVTSRAVSARHRELGIRVALGARRASLVRMVVLEESRPLVLGIALGLSGVVITGSVLSRFLFGVTAHDPLSFTGGAVVLLAAGLVASLLAARRAIALDPVQAIKAE